VLFQVALEILQVRPLHKEIMVDLMEEIQVEAVGVVMGL
jgi:hypothetical protein